jgi:hypothetical protein
MIVTQDKILGKKCWAKAMVSESATAITAGEIMGNKPAIGSVQAGRQSQRQRLLGAGCG